MLCVRANSVSECVYGGRAIWSTANMCARQLSHQERRESMLTEKHIVAARSLYHPGDGATGVRPITAAWFVVWHSANRGARWDGYAPGLEECCVCACHVRVSIPCACANPLASCVHRLAHHAAAWPRERFP